MQRRENKKSYTLEDGSIYAFDNSKFNMIIKQYLRDKEESGEKITKSELVEKISHNTNNSASTINHWLAGHNCPSEFEKIKDVADYLEYDVTEILEVEKEATDAVVDEHIDRKDEDNTMELTGKIELTNKEINVNVVTPKEIDLNDPKVVIREVYEVISDYLDDYRITVGFEYSEFYALEDDERYDMEVCGYNNIIYTLRKRMLDIPSSVYTQLLAFVKGYIDSMTGDIMDSIWNCTAPDRSKTDQNNLTAVYDDKLVRYDEFLDGADDNSWCRVEYVEVVVDTAYDLLADILKDYIAR